LFTSQHQLEPLVPPLTDHLRDLALQVYEASAAFDASLRTPTAEAIALLVTEMNCYYSNLIEGNHTKPNSIHKALQQDFSKEPKEKALQLLAVAHIDAELFMQQKLAQEPAMNVYSAEFLSTLHKNFCSRLPEELLWVKSEEGGERLKNIPGEFRSSEVRVGEHVPPTHASLRQFLERFKDVYTAPRDRVEQLVAAMAAHHRLVWIHPFLDGNGRVARLFTQACLYRLGINKRWIWSISRGLARKKKDSDLGFPGTYKGMLGYADIPRQGDLDGRGNLSAKALVAFCEFMLQICLDQIRYMSKCLELDELEKRIRNYVEHAHMRGTLRREAAYLVIEAFKSGQISRGDAGRITGLSERTARNLLGDLIRLGLLRSDSPKGPVKLGIPNAAAGWFFPELYPPGELENDFQLLADPSTSAPSVG
jgi:Fic family protein